MTTNEKTFSTVHVPILKNPKILVLGHGRNHRFRCSPVEKEVWFDKSYTCVDIDPDVKPDIVYDLNKFPWSFANDHEYGLIIDASGFALNHFYGHYRTVSGIKFGKELTRILQIGGEFIGCRGGSIYKMMLVDNEKLVYNYHYEI